MTAPTKEQLAAAKKVQRSEYQDCWASPVEMTPRIAALIARAESAEAERDKACNALRAVDKGIRAKVGRCCGRKAGKQFCESFGCGTLLELLALAAPAAEGGGDAT